MGRSWLREEAAVGLARLGRVRPPNRARGTKARPHRRRGSRGRGGGVSRPIVATDSAETPSRPGASPTAPWARRATPPAEEGDRVHSPAESEVRRRVGTSPTRRSCHRFPLAFCQILRWRGRGRSPSPGRRFRSKPAAQGERATRCRRGALRRRSPPRPASWGRHLRTPNRVVVGSRPTSAFSPLRADWTPRAETGCDARR